jgi:hypothetical protein
MKTSTCQLCNKNFIVTAGSAGKYCSRSCAAKYGNSLRIPKIKISDACCLQCSSPIYSPNKFCSRSCAGKFNNKLRPAGHPSRKTPNSNRGKNTQLPNYKSTRTKKEKLYCKISWCVICKKLIPESTNKTCSNECFRLKLREAGKKSAATRCKRSKDEIKLFQLCQSHYSSVRHNEPIVNGWDADIIDDISTAILWNGPWHYQSMIGIKNHSLSQVQTRDKIKIEQLKLAGWNVLIFEDRFYSPESAFDELILLFS